MKSHSPISRITAFSTLLLSALALSGVTAANAEPNPEAGGYICTNAENEAGNCLVALTPRGTDPLLAGISAAIEDGNGEQAEHYMQEHVAKSDLSAEDSTRIQRALDGIIEPADLLAPTDREISTFDTGAGSPSGPVHILNDVMEYWQCGPVGCYYYSIIELDYWYTLESTFEVSFSGDINVIEYNPVKFTSVECSTMFYRQILPDQSVHNWPSCSYWGQSDLAVSSRQIPTENWEGGSWGETYYVKYGIEVVAPTPDAKPASLTWTTDRYKIPDLEEGPLLPRWL